MPKSKEPSIRTKYRLQAMEQTIDHGTMAEINRLLANRQNHAREYNKGMTGYIASIRAINNQIIELLNLDL